jgi:hypothetical protein
MPRVPLLVYPRPLVVLSWFLAAGLSLAGVWSGAIPLFGSMSGVIAGSVLGLWSSEACPYRTKQWWALLFVVNLWGIELGMWFRLSSRSFAPGGLMLYTGLALVLAHIIMSVLAWRDSVETTHEDETVQLANPVARSNTRG